MSVSNEMSLALNNKVIYCSFLSNFPTSSMYVSMIDANGSKIWEYTKCFAADFTEKKSYKKTLLVCTQEKKDWKET